MLDYFRLLATKKNLLLLLVLALAACQPAVATSTLPPPETWRAQLTPALRWLGPVLKECTRQVPGTALLYDEEPTSALDLSRADFTFSLEPVSAHGYTAVLGQVGLAFIVNPANPVFQLDEASLEAIYRGEAVTWSDLKPESCPTCTPLIENPIKLFVYAPDDDLGKVFSGLFPSLVQKLPDAMLAPDPEAVRQAVAGDPDALGYVPAPVVDSSVRAVKISDISTDNLRIPLLLSAQAEPAGIKRSWVLCVQQNLP